MSPVAGFDKVDEVAKIINDLKMEVQQLRERCSAMEKALALSIEGYNKHIADLHIRKIG